MEGLISGIVFLVCVVVLERTITLYKKSKQKKKRKKPDFTVPNFCRDCVMWRSDHCPHPSKRKHDAIGCRAYKRRGAPVNSYNAHKHKKEN